VFSLDLFITFCPGLGATVTELGDLSNARKYQKTCFSMLLPEVHEELQSNEIKSIVLCGIETQACILVDENLCFFF